MKYLLFIISLLLTISAIGAQETPENRGIKKGEPVPPFFLQNKKGGWQSSESVFSRPLTVLWFSDISKLNKVNINSLKSLESDSISVYIIDNNKFTSNTIRKKMYHDLVPGLPVLLDYKDYASNAYGVNGSLAWFLVNNNGILIEFDYSRSLDLLFKSVKK